MALIGASRAILFGTAKLPPLTGDYLIDFTAMSDGVPAAATTAEPTLRDTVGDANTKLATVASGALVCAEESGTGTTATYSGARLREDIKSIYADVTWGSLSDSLALISTMTPSLASILASSLHIVFNASGWAVQYFSAGSITTVTTGAYPAVTLGKKYRVGWRVSGDDIVLRIPSGQEVTVTSAATATRANHSIVFEHNRAVAGVPALKIHKVAANIFTNPTAAGRTNLFSAINDLADAGWSKTDLQTPVVGQADADGGTLADKVLETATTAIHNIKQTLTKAASAKRYSLRYKVKGVNRDNVHIGVGTSFAGVSKYLGLSSGTLGTESGAYTDKSFMVYPLGNDWYQVQANFKSDTGTSVIMQLSVATGTTAGNVNYLGNTSNGLIIYDQWLFERPV